ncbi:hypothetical protein ACFFQW_42505 [Umezawaea endophytica]|uniref:Uncharacterized protein n=1 Tax=Umezawaea endophytica TaxID=1654476 RepID=A0A9X2VJU0_9PSEU|nr:hypothetical protein [Umezawaea endophytica]MCS7477936.1 hypothetical protein [Umezawaea endophytica]
MELSTSAPASLSLKRARAYLEEVADSPADHLSVLASPDAGFRHVVPRSAVRAHLRRTVGVDPGFDLGADAFAAMIGLALADRRDPVVPAELLDLFAERIALCRRRNRYGYFVDVPEFAADTDCTALSAAGLYEHGRQSRADLAEAARELVRAAAPPSAAREGLRPNVVLVYWDDAVEPSAPRRGLKHDAVVCANALYTLSLARESGAWDEGADVLEATARHVGAHLGSSEPLGGTRYYPDPTAFLFAVSRLCDGFEPHARSFRGALARRIATARTPDNPLSLALALIAGRAAGAPADQLDEWGRALVRGQRDDGSWPAAPYYRMGRFDLCFGSPLITTLFAVRALLGAPVRGTALGGTA